MKLSIKNFAFLAMAATAVTLTSCGDDTEDPIIPNRAPEISLRNADGSDFDRMVDVDINGNASVTVAITDPDANLNTIEFTRNGQKVVATSGLIRVDEDNNASTPFTNIAANPLLIVDNKGSYTRTFVFSGSTEFATTSTYAIIVTDAGTPALSTQETFTVTTRAEPVKRDSVRVISGKFFNRDGPFFGSLDLVTGDSIASSNTTAKSRLQDAGNGTNSVWAQEIIGEGDATIISIAEADLPNVKYADIAFADQIRDLVTRGTVPATGNGRTRKLNKGDVFLVRTDDRIYLVEVTDLISTGNNNEDAWVVSYKYGARS